MTDTVYSDSDKQRAFDLAMFMMNKPTSSSIHANSAISLDDKIQAFAKLYSNSLELLARQSVHTETTDLH
jgi:hypothetical protein